MKLISSISPSPILSPSSLPLVPILPRAIPKLKYSMHIHNFCFYFIKYECVYKQLIELAYLFEIYINGITWFILLQLFSLNFMLWVLPTLKYTELIHSHPTAWNQYMNVPKSINSFCFFFFTTKNNAATSTLTNILNTKLALKKKHTKLQLKRLRITKFNMHKDL